MRTVGKPMDRMIFLTLCSVLVSSRVVEMPVLGTLVDPSCVDPNFLVLSHGVIIVLRLATLAFTLRPHTLSIGLTLT